MSVLRAQWLPILVILAGFSASLYLAFSSLSFLISNTIPDDSFYYFQIARNITEGLGSTFDGVNPTNGYHPLWMLVLLPLYALFSQPIVLDVAPIHAALAVSAVFNALLGFVLLAIMGRYTDSPWIKAVALGVWFFNPYNQYHVVDGLETALSLLCIATFLWVALRFKERPSDGNLALVGISAGLMMLARLDNVFYFVMFLLWLVYDRGLYKSVRPILFVGVIATLVVSPWLLFNYLVFGMLFTSASVAYTIVNHEIIKQDNGASLFQQLKAVVYMTDYSLRSFLVPNTGAPSVFLVVLGAAAGFLLSAKAYTKDLVRHVPLEIFVFGGFVLVFFVNAGIRWSPREWYFAALNLFIALGVAWLLQKLRERDMLPPFVVVGFCFLTLALFFINWEKSLRDSYNTADSIFEATLWMNDNLPADASIGAFNAGIVAYFSTHRVINLDGLVNNRAYEAIRDRRVWQYVKDEKIDFLADNGKRVAYRMRGLLGVPDVLQELVPVQDFGGDPTIYSIK